MGDAAPWEPESDAERRNKLRAKLRKKTRAMQQSRAGKQAQGKMMADHEFDESMVQEAAKFMGSSTRKVRRTLARFPRAPKNEEDE